MLSEWSSVYNLGEMWSGGGSQKSQTLYEKVVTWQFDRANNRILAGDNLVMDPTSADNHMEIKR
jgi:hypothetical protein